MARAATLNVRVDYDTKSQAEKVFSQLGTSTSNAINMFLSCVAREHRIPVDLSLRVPNAETLAAMEEAEKISRGEIPAKMYTDVDEMFADILAED